MTCTKLCKKPVQTPFANVHGEEGRREARMEEMTFIFTRRQKYQHPPNSTHTVPLFYLFMLSFLTGMAALMKATQVVFEYVVMMRGLRLMLCCAQSNMWGEIFFPLGLWAYRLLQAWLHTRMQKKNHAKMYSFYRSYWSSLHYSNLADTLIQSDVQ